MATRAVHCRYNIIIIFVVFCCICFIKCELNLSEGSPCETNGLNGTCVNVFNCSSAALTYLFRNAGFEYNLPEFPDICSYNSNEPIVCCTDCKQDEDTYRNSAVVPAGMVVHIEGTVSRRKCLDYFQRLPYPCRGASLVVVRKYWIKKNKCHDYTYDLGEGIIMGRPAKRWEFPHAALIGYGDDVETAQWLCGGSVISEKFILTAAHCTFTETLGNISFAALGLLKRSDPKKYWKIYKIKRIIIHPEYRAPSKYHDIALLETEHEINFGKDLLPACLGNSKETEAQAAGWGSLGRNQGLADNLQIVELNEFNETECAKIYKKHRNLKHGYDVETQMCYGSHDDIVDTCQGDSGGPLQLSDYNCQYSIIGVTSYGKGCGILGSAGMYTRVAYYIPWIENVVWPEETEGRQRICNTPDVADVEW